MTTTVSGSQITFNDNTTQNTSAYGGGFAMRNRIINGDFRIDQRNAGASFTPTNSSYGLDRWTFALTQASKFTAQQNAGSVTPPVGFSNYLGITSSSAYSITSGDIFYVRQLIEGFNTADLAFGTANAQTVTLSFWVRSSLTGTFGGALQNSAENRSYPFSYTISSANTWEQKTLTITGDTSGTWIGSTNGIGISVIFGLGVGSTYTGTANAWQGAQDFAPTGATSIVGTNGATWYITGVQLEKGSTATSFDYRPYGQELALCQRYYWRIYSQANYTGYGNGWNVNTSSGAMLVKYPVTMRAKATSIDYSLLSSTVLGASEALVATATLDGTNYAGTDTSVINISSSGLFTTGFATLTAKASTSSYLGFSAEL